MIGEVWKLDSTNRMDDALQADSEQLDCKPFAHSTCFKEFQYNSERYAQA